MDFFSQQDKAKRYTKVLVLYFIVAIALIVVAINAGVFFLLIYSEESPYTFQDWLSEGPMLYVSAATVLLILFGSFFRWLKLRSGGHAVAKMVGATLLDLHTTDNKKRQLIHVVEEMSIASGVPLPALYVLENENAINAFVAGYQPTETVMVITAGAIENFSREEMQGVVAHEYSHILNGDMQINLRLMAALAGILMISAVGRILLSGRHRSSGKNGAGVILALGLMFLAIGFIGVFFGRMIKAAVSRQREYLADAASVQFTRNPQGIASALNKIREFQYGSSMQNVFAEDMSHMCFSQSFTQYLAKWMATHPPLIERIKCVDESFLARIKARKLSKKNRSQSVKNENINSNISPAGLMGFAGDVEPVNISAKEFVGSAGQVNQSYLGFAEEIHNSFSEELMSAVHQTEKARLVMLNLVLAKMDFTTGIEFLKTNLKPFEIAEIESFRKVISALKNFQRLPLFDLLLPALKQMPPNERADYIELCERLIKSDKRYTLFEFIFISLLKQHLSEAAGKDIKVKYYSYKSLRKEIQILFSVMAHSGKKDNSSSLAAYEQVASGFPMQAKGQTLTLLSTKNISLNKISESLKKLSQLSPILKRGIIEASADIALHDGQLNYAEAEFLRAISELLNTPIPPLLPQVVH